MQRLTATYGKSSCMRVSTRMCIMSASRSTIRELAVLVEVVRLVSRGKLPQRCSGYRCSLTRMPVTWMTRCAQSRAGHRHIHACWYVEWMIDVEFLCHYFECTLRMRGYVSNMVNECIYVACHYCCSLWYVIQWTRWRVFLIVSYWVNVNHRTLFADHCNPFTNHSCFVSKRTIRLLFATRAYNSLQRRTHHSWSCLVEHDWLCVTCPNRIHRSHDHETNGRATFQSHNMYVHRGVHMRRERHCRTIL